MADGSQLQLAAGAGSHAHMTHILNFTPVNFIKDDTILISSVSGYGMENLRKIIYEKI